MVAEEWYKCTGGQYATYDYSVQANKLYNDLQSKGFSEEDVDKVIWDVARYLFPCDPCEEHLGEAMVYLFAEEVSADTFIATIQDVKAKTLSDELVKQKVDVLACILSMSDDEIAGCTNKIELLNLISSTHYLQKMGMK